MAIEGLENLVNSFDNAVRSYDREISHNMKELQDYIDDKTFVKFYDRKLREFGVSDANISSISDSNKLEYVRKLANAKALEQSKNGETKKVKGKDGKEIEVLANAWEDFVAEYDRELNKHEGMLEIITRALVMTQEDQAKKIYEVEKDVYEIKKELDERVEEDKKLEQEENEIKIGNSKYDKEINEKNEELEQYISQIARNIKLLNVIRAQEGKQNVSGNDEFDRLLTENVELDKKCDEIKLNITKLETQKSNRLADISKERSDLKIPEYTGKYNDFSEKIIDAKEKYQENSVKISEQFKKLGKDPKEILNGNNLGEKEKVDQPSKQVSQNGKTVANGQQLPVNEQSSNKALEPTNYATRSSFDKASSFANIEKPEDGLDRLSHTNDFSDIMATLRDPSKNGKLKKTNLRDTLAKQAELLSNNMKDLSEHCKSVEDALGRELTEEEKSTLENMFDENNGKKFLNGNKEYSKKELASLIKIINDVSQRGDLTPAQREAFSKDFLQYAQMNCFTRQNDKVALTKFFENKFSLGKGKSQKGLEQAISNYVKQTLDRDRSSKDNYFNMLQNGRVDNPRYTEMSEPDKSRQRSSRTR